MFKMFTLKPEVRKRNWKIEDIENNFTVEIMDSTDEATWLYQHLAANSEIGKVKLYCKL